MNSIIITHNDFDGIYSGAILYKHLNNANETLKDLIISTPKRLHKTLEELALSFSRPDKIYIADISLNKEFYKQTSKNLEIMNKKNIQIFWYDHHEWDNNTLNDVRNFCTTLIVDTKYKSAAELMVVENTGIKKDDYMKKMVRSIKNRTNGQEEKEWSGHWKQLFENATKSRDYNKIKKVIKEFTFNKKAGVFDWFQKKGSKKMEDASVKYAQKSHRIETTQQGRKFIIIDMRNKKNLESNTVRKEALNYHNCDIYCIVFSNMRLQIGKGHKTQIKFDKLLNLKSIDNIKYNVKGHLYVVSISFKTSPGSLIKSIFSIKKLNDETEKMIEKIIELY